MDFNALETLTTQWPTDWIIIGAFAAFMALDALRSGSTRAAALMLSLPAALLVTNALQGSFFLGPLSAQFTAPNAQAGIFVAIAIFLYLAVHRAIFSFSDSGGVVQALIAGLAVAVVFVVVWLQVPALQSVWQLGPQVQAVFSETYRFWWLIASYVALAFVRS